MMGKTLKVLVAAGAIYGAWSLYEKYCPECAADLRNAVCDMKHKATKSMENMM